MGSNSTPDTARRGTSLATDDAHRALVALVRKVERDLEHRNELEERALEVRDREVSVLSGVLDELRESRVERPIVRCEHEGMIAFLPPGADVRAKLVSSNGMTFTRAIVAVDGGGRPMCWGERALVYASELAGFSHVVEREEVNMGVLPAAGWRVEVRNPDGSLDDEPIAGFLIDAGGWGQALCTDGDGVVSLLESAQGVRVYHPTARFREADEAVA